MMPSTSVATPYTSSGMVLRQQAASDSFIASTGGMLWNTISSGANHTAINIGTNTAMPIVMPSSRPRSAARRVSMSVPACSSNAGSAAPPATPNTMPTAMMLPTR